MDFRGARILCKLLLLQEKCEFRFDACIGLPLQFDFLELISQDFHVKVKLALLSFFNAKN